jgi:hypothetical protein
MISLYKNHSLSLSNTQCIYKSSDCIRVVSFHTLGWCKSGSTCLYSVPVICLCYWICSLSCLFLALLISCRLYSSVSLANWLPIESTKWEALVRYLRDGWTRGAEQVFLPVLCLWWWLHHCSDGDFLQEVPTSIIVLGDDSSSWVLITSSPLVPLVPGEVIASWCSLFLGGLSSFNTFITSPLS